MGVGVGGGSVAAAAVVVIVVVVVVVIVCQASPLVVLPLLQAQDDVFGGDDAALHPLHEARQVPGTEVVATYGGPASAGREGVERG